MFCVNAEVQGTFNQGHPKFGETAGVQCACNALFSICWSKVRKINQWTTSDLDHILDNGDSIYKYLLYGPGPLNQICHLNVDDLPREINLSHGQISLDFLELKDGELSFDNQDASLVSLFYSVNATGDGFLIFVNGVTLAVMYNDSQNSYYLFDSHSRNNQGLPVPDGTSVLLKCTGPYEIENYLKRVYLHMERRSCFFQLQFIKVDITEINKQNLRQNFRNSTRHVSSETLESPNLKRLRETRNEKLRQDRASKFGSAERKETRKIDSIVKIFLDLLNMNK